ncbi:protein-L-isoaspartate O-methyltransferase [Trichoderma afarasin]
MSQNISHSSNASLVEHLWANGLIHSPLVKSAFLKVDRGHYVNCNDPYGDRPQIIGYQATISAPYMHAKAAELLLPYLIPRYVYPQQNTSEVYPASNGTIPRRILDIGSGSGYLVHLFAEIAGKTALVVGVDHQEDLRKLGEANMRKSANGAKLIASGQVRFCCGDGHKGWSEPDGHQAAGWNDIHVGATAIKLYDELVQQLSSPGRMFIPILEEEGNWFSDTYVWTVDKDINGNLTMAKHFKASFVSLKESGLGFE